MVIGQRLRAIREAKGLSQGDVERRTGALRTYLSRMENGHTVPSLETLEKLARALEVPLYRLFYDGKAPPRLPRFPARRNPSEELWGSSGKEARELNRNFRFQLHLCARPYTSRPLASISDRLGRGW